MQWDSKLFLKKLKTFLFSRKPTLGFETNLKKSEIQFF
jgi:hypothetical protein